MHPAVNASFTALLAATTGSQPLPGPAWAFVFPIVQVSKGGSTAEMLLVPAVCTVPVGVPATAAIALLFFCCWTTWTFLGDNITTRNGDRCYHFCCRLMAHVSSGGGRRCWEGAGTPSCMRGRLQWWRCTSRQAPHCRAPPRCGCCTTCWAWRLPTSAAPVPAATRSDEQCVPCWGGWWLAQGSLCQARCGW